MSAREEHAAIPAGRRSFNSPNERARVFLAPLLSNKGSQWATVVAVSSKSTAMTENLLS
jgi:hypothetical protein